MKFKEFLKTVPEFSCLSARDADDFEHIMRVNTYPDEYEFFKEGTAGHDIYLIIDGEVSVTHKKGIERKSFEIRRLKTGEMFGLLSVITDQEHVATCTAVGTVVTASMSNQAFKLLFGSNSVLGLQFQIYITSQLARDYSSLINLLRAALSAKNEEESRTIFSSYSDNIPKNTIGQRPPVH
jgi:CRP-like cAMP-binding protein